VQVKAELESLAAKTLTQDVQASDKPLSKEVGTSQLAKIESSLRQE
jgi:hypothetical protein